MSQFIPWILAHLTYPWIGFLMLLESTVIPVPSEVVVPPAAWIALTGDQLNVILVVLIATLGADLGSTVNYVVARWVGRPIVYAFADSWMGKLCLLNSQKVQSAEKYFDDHGATATLIGRLIPGIRHLISIPAGLARMNYWRFIAYTTLGAGLWNIVLACIGYALTAVAKSPEEVAALAEKYSHEIGYGILAVVVVGIVYLIVKKKRKKKV